MAEDTRLEMHRSSHVRKPNHKYIDSAIAEFIEGERFLVITQKPITWKSQPLLKTQRVEECKIAMDVKINT